MSERILMIEDDRGLASMVREYLATSSIDVTVCHDAASGLATLERGAFDALILDVMLPDRDGFDICRSVRARSSIPIVMLTARGDETDRIVGLELGADDYLPKPFNPRELLARLRAVLRRTTAGAQAPGGEVARYGNLEIDRNARVVRLEGVERPLTAYQFDLLCALADNAGRVMTRDMLMSRVRGDSHEAFDRSIDVHVSRIRSAIEEDPAHPRRILTIRGTGYVFARRPDE
ncbi:MAG TPA: response regulator transcription factor [Candidatus Binatia bacterium]|nr:response regulator transcription factor [Candidatus Binatia bacterium]